MIFPLCAKYGFKNNSHDLLEWNGDEQPPRELLGLTDKPAGHMAPMEQWWPALSCGKIGEWWAIWSIEPDPDAPRGGMVKSKVFLWPISEISKVDDLAEYISTLVVRELESLSEKDQHCIDNLLNELTSSEQTLIVDSVRLLPHIINTLWKNLWGEAKIDFAIRMSFTPPQSFNRSNHPTFYCVPLSLTNQWFSHGVKVISPQVSTELCRAARYLNGNNDDIITELINVCGQRTGDIKFLGRLARAADNVDVFRGKSTAPNIISALRSTIACAGKSSDALALKSELLLGLKVHFEKNTISVEQVLSLSNFFEENLLEENLPKKELINWVTHNLPDVIPDTLTSIFERCSPTKSRIWWRASVEAGIKLLLDTTNADDKLIYWLTMEVFSSLAEKFVYTANDTDNRLFKLAKGKGFSSLELEKLEFIAIGQNFPKLYSLVIHQLYPETSVINKQMNSMKGWEQGIPYLVDNLKSSILLEAIEIEGLEFIIPLVAVRCKEDTTIVKAVDIAKEGAYALWCLQLENGGVFYPPSIDKNSFRKKLLDNLSSKLSDNTFERIIAEVAEYLLKSPDKTDFFARFDVAQRKKIADELVNILTTVPNISFNLNWQEVDLLQSVKNYFNSNSDLSPQLLTSCLAVPISSNEHEILKWIFKVNKNDWPIHANKLGEVILLQQWSHIAKELYKESYTFFGTKKHFKPVVKQCESLLGQWERMTIGYSNGSSIKQSNALIMNRLSTLGAELAPEGLNYIWLRAGGNPGALYLHGTISEKWLQAVRAAESGALDNGMKSIIYELLEGYPNNKDLKELNALIK